MALRCALRSRRHPAQLRNDKKVRALDRKRPQFARREGSHLVTRLCLTAESAHGVVVELDGHARRGERERQSESKKNRLHGGSPVRGFFAGSLSGRDG